MVQCVAACNRDSPLLLLFFEVWCWCWCWRVPYPLGAITDAVACVTRRALVSRQYTGPGRGVLIALHARVIWPLTSHPHKARTEHAGFSLD